jgi:signal transduction histidine kinase
LRFQHEQVEFCLRDDGTGFDIQAYHDGMGLDSMRERAEAHNGMLQIESAIGHGTEIYVTFPIE